MERTDLLAHYKRIIEISQQLGTTYDHVSLLRKIVVAAIELLRTEVASILLLDENTGQLRFAMSSNIKAHEMEEITVPLEGSIAGWIFTRGEPRVIEDVSQEPIHFQGVDNKISFNTRNLLGVPMRTHKRVIGVVQAVNKVDGERFTDDDVETLRTLASQAAMAIENAKLFQQSDFIAEMVHELRNPLAALKASINLIQRSGVSPEKKEDVMETMVGETDRLINLTNDFLSVARLESGRVTLDVSHFPLQKLITESVKVVTSQATEKNIDIVVPELDYTAEADRGRVKQVLLNLLTNGIKYNRPDGTLTIVVEPVETPEHPMLQISVQDTGYGIPLEHRKNMFQKFYRVPTLQDVAKGTGLGLAICKNIVESHGGRIWLDSEVDVGSTFYFTIPRPMD